jgi:hypothetical protein
MRFGHRFDQTGKAGNAPLRLDWLAGAAGFEPPHLDNGKIRGGISVRRRSLVHLAAAGRLKALTALLFEAGLFTSPTQSSRASRRIAGASGFFAVSQLCVRPAA